MPATMIDSSEPGGRPMLPLSDLERAELATYLREPRFNPTGKGQIVLQAGTHYALRWWEERPGYGVHDEAFKLTRPERGVLQVDDGLMFDWGAPYTIVAVLP